MLLGVQIRLAPKCKCESTQSTVGKWDLREAHLFLVLITASSLPEVLVVPGEVMQAQREATATLTIFVPRPTSFQACLSKAEMGVSFHAEEWE